MNIGFSSLTHREVLLKYIRQFCEPETCAAMTFKQFVELIGDEKKAEIEIKNIWEESLIAPTGAETDSLDGALFEVDIPSIKSPIKLSTQFVLTSKGYSAVEPLYDLSYFNRDKKDLLYQPPTEIITSTKFINEQLLIALKNNSEKMYNLTPREFEEFVAELFLKDGFDVELTPERNDGGRDIIAISHNHLGKHLYYAECKRYAPKSPVGVEYIRSLYGILEKDKATKGIIATTSYFTKGAKDFNRELMYRLELLNYADLSKWLKKHS